MSYAQNCFRITSFILLLSLACPDVVRAEGNAHDPRVKPILPSKRYKPVPGKNRDQRPTSRIVGGQESDPGEWPWMVALLQSGVPDAFDAQFCGGALVHPYWVVSAAHCLIGERPEDVEVLIGTTDLSNVAGAQRIAVEEIILHPDYNDFTLDSDVALLRLAVPVSPVPQLLPLVDEAALNAVGVTGTVIGWGATNGPGTAYAVDLMEVEVPIVDLAVANAPASHDGSLTANMLPAGFAAGGKDSCSGDSGGPFMVPSPFPPGWMLAGIVSFGLSIDCAAPDNYGIYTRVLSFRDFINNYITPHYGAFEVTEGVVGQNRDPEFDLIPNFVEFAFRSNPNAASTEDMPGSALVGSPGSYVPAIRYRRPILAHDVAYGVGYTDDLGPGFSPYDLLANLAGMDPVPGDPEATDYTVLPPAGGFNADIGYLQATVVASHNLVNAKRNLSYPGAIQGSLTDEDLEHPTLAGHFIKEYALHNAPVGQSIMVTLRSTEFDASLEIVDADTGAVLFTDPANTGGGNDEKITFTPGAGTNYCLRATSTSAAATGFYTLALFTIDGTLPVINVPDTANGTLAMTDDFDPIYLPGLEFYKDDFVLNAAGGTDVEATLTAAAFDAFLEVINSEDGEIVTSNDDGAGGTDSRVTFATQPGLVYYLRVTTSSTLQTGAYTLSTAVPSPSPTIAIESVETGSLTTGDATNPNLSGNYYIDDFDLTGVSVGDQVVLDQISPDFDSFLELVNKATGAVIIDGDDYSGTVNARILFTVQAGITYVVRVGTFDPDTTGSYSISAQRLPDIQVPQSIGGALTFGDGIDNRFTDNYRVDDYELTGVTAGQSVTVTMSSVEVDSWLTVLERDAGTVIVEDDDGAGLPNARLTFTVQAGTEYLIRATTAFDEETGSYTLTTQTP